MGRRHAPGATAERPEVLTDVLITGIHPSGAGIARLSDNSKSKDVPDILVPGALPGARMLRRLTASPSAAAVLWGA